MPTYDEWATLVDYLGGGTLASYKLKEAGIAHWPSPNTGSTNSSGFTGLPNGYRVSQGTFVEAGNYGGWWSSTATTETYALNRALDNNYATVWSIQDDKRLGFSVRCIQGESTVIPALPVINTSMVSSITLTSAISGGSIPSDGGATVTARGVCWSTTSVPTTSDNFTSDGIGTGSYGSSITGLTAGTTYYVRAYATNYIGTSYGNEVSFTTTAAITNCGTLTDIDGNNYTTVTIGAQCWMAENLRTTRYRNGDPIPNVTDNTAWAALNTGAFSWYNNDAASYQTTYGALYNWYSVADSRNICPTGWHVPTDDELTTLTTFLGDLTVGGGKLKEAGTTHWLIPNTGATNETGFTFLPGGDRADDGACMGISTNGYFWSSTEYPLYSFGFYRYLIYNYSNIFQNSINKAYGFSVRCIKDSP